MGPASDDGRGCSQVDGMTAEGAAVPAPGAPAAPSSRSPRLPGTGMLLAVLAAVVAAYAFVWTVGLDLAIRPPLPARIQADDLTGLVSLLADLTARLAALATLGVLAGVVVCVAGAKRFAARPAP